MKKISRKAARFVLTCLGLFVILICIACATQNAMFFAAGMVIAIGPAGAVAENPLPVLW